MKKKSLIIGITALVICVLCISLVACNPDDSTPGEATSFVSLDINPSIELTLDKNNKVVSVYGANEDGQVLLYGESGIVGEDVEKAVEKITSLAIELGYIDETNKVIQTSVTATVGNEELQNKINTQITASATKLNMNVSISGADAYSLLRKLEQLKAQYPDNNAIQSLTSEKLKIVISASEAGDISIEAAAELDTEKLLKVVSDAHKTAKEYATQAYDKAAVMAKDAYEAALGSVSDGIYTTYYMAHHPLKAYYGFAYQGYKATARGLDATANALEFVEKISEYPLDETQIMKMAEILGLGTNVDALKNSNGEITVKSIEAYADKMFKNSEASEELEQLKSELSDALSSVENAVSEKIKELSEEYAPQIEIINNSLNTIIDGLKGLEQLIPTTIMNQLQELKSDLTELSAAIAEIISDGNINSEELRTLAKLAQAKSDNALAQIQADLSDEELEEIAALQKSAADSIANAKAQMESAITEAEQAAKAYLENLKNQRKAN